MNKLLEQLARAFAIFGGIVMVAITLVTTGSVIGRAVFGSPLLGDTELVQVGMGIAVASFMPMCQWRGGNIIVDFFTTKASPATRSQMDRFGALLVAVMLGLIAWRTVHGAIGQKESGSTTMLMQWPEWIPYSIMVIPLALTALTAFYTAVTGQRGGSEK